MLTLNEARYLLTDSLLTAEEPAVNPPPDDPLLPLVCESLKPIDLPVVLPAWALTGPSSTPTVLLEPLETEALDPVVSLRLLPRLLEDDPPDVLAMSLCSVGLAVLVAPDWSKLMVTDQSTSIPALSLQLWLMGPNARPLNCWVITGKNIFLQFTVLYWRLVARAVEIKCSSTVSAEAFTSSIIALAGMGSL